MQTLRVTLATFRGMEELSKRAGRVFTTGPAHLTNSGLIAFDVDEDLYEALLHRARPDEDASDVVTRLVQEKLEQ